MAPIAKPTAYFVFADQHRAQVKQNLLLLSGEGATVPVASVAKALGEKWAGLSDEEKAVYKEMAQRRAQEAQEAADAAAAAAAADGHPEGAPEDCPSAGIAEQQRPALPRGVVRRTMLADADVSRASADSVWCVGRAAELFIELLAVRGAAAAASKRRATVKLEDVDLVVRQDKRLVEMGLKEVVADADMYAAAHVAKPRAKPAGAAKQAPDGSTDQAAGKGDASGEGADTGVAPKRAGRAPKGKGEGGVKHSRPITTFFAAAGAGS